VHQESRLCGDIEERNEGLSVRRFFRDIEERNEGLSVWLLKRHLSTGGRRILAGFLSNECQRI
jgi:hypothetical protein